MTKYLLVDSLNTFFRARYSAPRKADSWTKIGFAIHVTLSSVNKSFHKEGIDHVVFCTEGKSWRKSIYEPYKRNRKELRDKKSTAELAEDEEYFEAYSNMIEFLRETTNCIVLHNPIAEADDLIARWIAKHPNDEHVIMSSDSDFVQLITEKVSIYNGIQNQIINHEGYFNDSGGTVKDKKTGKPKEIVDPKWSLFEKCVRGDTSDNIFSAYPGVRKKGTVNKIGMEEAYADKNSVNSKGFAWNNFMLQRWTDHKGVEHIVKNDFERNELLIDLTKQPADLKEYIDETIDEQTVEHERKHIGRYFMRFCGKYDLNKLSEYSVQYNKWLTAKYIGDKNES